MNAETITITAADLKARREAVGITQEQLGDCIGYSRAGVSHWEQGHSPVRASEAPKVNAVLGLLTIVQWRERSAFHESRARLDEMSATLDRVTAERDAAQLDAVQGSWAITALMRIAEVFGCPEGCCYNEIADDVIAKHEDLFSTIDARTEERDDVRRMVTDFAREEARLQQRADHLLMRTEIIATERDEARRKVERLEQERDAADAECSQQRRGRLTATNSVTALINLLTLIRRRIEADTGPLEGETVEALTLWAQDVCPDPSAWGSKARAVFDDSAEAAHSDGVAVEMKTITLADTVDHRDVGHIRRALLSMACKAVAEWAESGRPPMGQILAAAQTIEMLE